MSTVELAVIRDFTLYSFDRGAFDLPVAPQAWAVAPGTGMAAVLVEDGTVFRFDGSGFVPSHHVPPLGYDQAVVSADGTTVAASSWRDSMLLAVHRWSPDDPAPASWEVLRPDGHVGCASYAIAVSATGAACAVHWWSYDPRLPRDVQHDRDRLERLSVFGIDGRSSEREITVRESIVDIDILEEGPVLVQLTNDQTAAEWLDSRHDVAWEVLLDGAALQSSLSRCGSVLVVVMEDGACWIADRRTKRKQRVARAAIAAHARVPNRIRWMDRHLRTHEHVVLPGIPPALERLLDEPEGRRVLEDWAIDNDRTALARALKSHRRRRR